MMGISLNDCKKMEAEAGRRFLKQLAAKLELVIVVFFLLLHLCYVVIWATKMYKPLPTKITIDVQRNGLQTTARKAILTKSKKDCEKCWFGRIWHIPNNHIV